jgi:hypothetical protein
MAPTPSVRGGLRVREAVATLDSMVRVQLRCVKPRMRLARPLTGPDGAVAAGVGTTLTPSLIRMLLAMGVESVWIAAGTPVAEWEEDKDLDRALADLEARFAREGTDPIRDALEAALREHIRARAVRSATDPA